MELHVIQTDDGYLVVEEFSTKGDFRGAIWRGKFCTLQEANKFIEDAVPVNNVGGGQLAGVSPGEAPPVFKKRKTIFYKRKRPK